MNTKAKGFKKLVALLLFATMALQAMPAVFADEAETAGAEVIVAPKNSLDEMEELLNSTTYDEYKEIYKADGIVEFPQNSRPDAVKATLDIEASTDGVKILTDKNGVLSTKEEDPEGLVSGLTEYVLTEDGSTAVYKVKVEKPGFYNIRVPYYPFANLYYDNEGNIVAAPTELDTKDYSGNNHIEGNTVAIERVIKIDGEVPFKDARNIAFSRVWKDHVATDKEGNVIEPDEYGRAFRLDISNNEIRSKKYEDPYWREQVLRDSNAFYDESFLFYFGLGDEGNGEHTIELYSSREPVLYGEIEIFVEDELPSYADYYKSYADKGAKSASAESFVKVQAEVPVATSDQVIYPMSDKTSPITEPSDPGLTLVNTIGGEKWQIAGQWISYDIEVPESGFYYIIPRARQSLYAGIFASRSLKINGKYPFEEAKFLQFNYSDDWKADPLNHQYRDENGNLVVEQLQFYFEGGKKYTIELECVLGRLSGELLAVDESLVRMNEYYRQILMITGPEPDTYTDYGFNELIPEVMRGMRVESENLRAVLARFEEIIGEKGEHSVLLERVAYTLEVMGNDETKVAENLSILKSYIGSIGTWLLQSRNQPLQMDYILVQGVDQKLPKGEAGFFSSIWFEIKSFFMSFFTDYNTYGAMEDFSQYEGQIVEVWLTTGRDQAQIMREMVDEFTANTKIAVNYKLVAAGTLLPATLAGIGPDVSTDADPTGFGVRNAVKNLAERNADGTYKYEGFDMVRGIGDYEGQGWFDNSAWTGLTVYNPEAEEEINKEAVYGVPVTQSFNMIFYRKDIFVELGLDVPQTWEDVFDVVIPKLADKNMTMGFSQGMTQILMYQMNEPYYKGDGDIRSVGHATNLDSNTSLDAFQTMCELFTLHSQPVSYDFANRFRTGEMPIGIADYSLCNQLLCFAPEIKGLWEFIRLPGTVTFDAEGNPSFSAVSPTGVSAIMIMGDAKNEQNAWEYIKWWVGAEAQERFGKEQVAIMGAAAKYTTANKQALFGQPWSAQERNNLADQFDHLMGTPMTPGNYIVGRYTNFAFLDAYDNGDVPSDAMLYYIDEINKEITRKRAEYDFYTTDELLEMGIIGEDGYVVKK